MRVPPNLIQGRPRRHGDTACFPLIADFEIVLVCIGTEDVEINVLRIQKRVLAVPEATMFRRRISGDVTYAVSKTFPWR